MNENLKYGLVGLIILVVLALPVWLVIGYSTAPGQLDDFAACLSQKGAKFYGAFWCPHCQDQKALFGKSAKNLPYIECSNADGKGQTSVCTAQKIESYPTWIFSDGSRLTGSQSLKDLAKKTSCVLN